MLQAVFFTMLFVALLVGFLNHFNPSSRVIHSFNYSAGSSSGENAVEIINRQRTEEINLSMNKGLLQIRKLTDDVSQEEEKFTVMINDEKQALENTKKDIDDIISQENGMSDKDVLKLRTLGLELQVDQRLLVAHGQSLISLRDKLNKSRQWLAEQNKLVGNGNDLPLNTQNSGVLNDQADLFADRIKQQNEDLFQRNRDLIEQNRQKLRDFQNK